MIYSIALVLLVGLLFSIVANKLKLPRLIGMLVAGFLIGPYCLDFLDGSLLDISSYLRQIALVIILTKAGLGLDINALKKVGRPAILMCFIPACFEIVAITFLGQYLLGISLVESMLLGSVLAAVSPAVVVPFILKMKDERYGEKSGVGEIVLAGSSCDDIFVITLFYSLLSLAKDNKFNASSLIQVPTSIILAIILGVLVGMVLSYIFKRINMSVAYKIMITLATSFLLIGFEQLIEAHVSISALLAVMVYNIVLNVKNKEILPILKDGYNSLWIFFEIILFVLVGASLNIELALDYGFKSILLILSALVFRSFGVFVCLLKTKLNNKEKLFCTISYIPKATVQASIGGIALQNGLSCGSLVLTISIISILITAPLGSILMQSTYKKLLRRDNFEEC